ncbi:hypothetical protein Mgra_00000425 [Meloidogyne graminicola]|uniref:Uncharacterized protein n=1 Tax=Meloidogyne graminicola TaxID=189291 RepID=A0A8T0A345_9BILA|nr:hypothetical protein Mgra_00000425 [Meloidogyne graminicola]
MSNSSDSLTTDDSNLLKAYSANEIAELLHLGQDFASYLEKQPYSEDDPIVVFDFLHLKQEQMQLIIDVLTSMRNIDGKMTVFATKVGGNCFKFNNWQLYQLAREEFFCKHPSLFFLPSNRKDGFNYGDFSDVPTAKTVVITFYSDEDSKFIMLNWQFFGLP